MNRNNLAYMSNRHDAFSWHDSPFAEPAPAFPGTRDMVETEKRRSPIRRVAKLNIFSKLFSASRRDVKESRKSSRDLGMEKHNGSKHSTMKTATTSSTATTLHLSRDAEQVFSNLRRPKLKSPRQGGVSRQKSEHSMIGSLLEIPSSNGSSVEDDLTTQQYYPTYLQTSPRPHIVTRPASFRMPSSTTSTPSVAAPATPNNHFQRAKSARSVAHHTGRASLKDDLADHHQLHHHNFVRIPSSSSVTSRAPTIEITPGHYQVLRGHQETLEYVRRDEVDSTVCLFCDDTVYAVQDAAMVICPTCRSISPMLSDGAGHGLALGFCGHEWLDIQREALMALE